MTTATISRLEIVEALTKNNPYGVRNRAYSNWVDGAYRAIEGEPPPLDTEPTATHQGYAWGQQYINGEIA